MRYVECPERYEKAPQDVSLYLAGGITGCPDWQSQMVEWLRETHLVLLNPRRRQFPIHDATAAEEQIRWEHEHLQVATAILFWFPSESLCPIALFEYGKWLVHNKLLFVGAHADHRRRSDLELQTKLERVDQPIHGSLELLVRDIREWLDTLDYRAKEVERRAEEMRTGKVVGIRAEDVFAELRKKYDK